MGYLNEQELYIMRCFRQGAQNATNEDLLKMWDELKDGENHMQRMAHTIVTIELDSREVIKFNEETDEYELA